MARKYLIPILLLLVALLPGCGGGGDYYEDDYYDPYYDSYDPTPLRAVPDFYETLADTTLFVNARDGLLANDLFSRAFIEFPQTTDLGGGLVVNEDGSFVYTPPRVFDGVDSFTYTLIDDFGESSALVTITVRPTGTPNPGVFVDNATGNDGTGNPATGAPFASLTEALAQAGPNAVIVIRAGSGQPYAGTFQLQDGQQLIGAGFENVTPQGQVRPILSGNVILANGNIVRGLSFQNTNGDAINGDDSRNATVSNCVFANSTAGGRAVSGERASGTWVVDGNSIDAMADAGIRLATAGNSTLRADVRNNTITDCTLSAISFLAEGTSSFTASVIGNVMSGNDPGFTFDVLAVENATVRLDLEGNSNDDVYFLSTLNFNGVFQVENLSTLQQRNVSGTVVLSEDPGSTPITEIPDNSI